MREQRGLDFRTGDVVAGGDDHVVGARGEVKTSIRVAHERIAGQIPAVAHVCALALVGEIAAAGRTAHREPADGARRHLVHVVVDDLRFIAGHRPSRRAGMRVADAVGDEDVQKFGGADAVENRLAGLL